MSYTKEQETIVLKVLSYKPHQFYEILSVSKTSNDNEIKKSYRKLAVKLHPDKNPHPRASEAFKYLNKAWSVLGDESKKRIYDQTGSDPDSRGGFGGGATSASTSGFARGGGFGGGPTNLDEDIFNMFFGGGPGGGASGPGFAFGNNGFTFQTFGGGDHPFFSSRQFPRGNNARRQQQQQQQRAQEPSIYDTLKQLLPLLLFLIVPILSALFSDSNSTPDYSFSPNRHYNTERYTPKHKIPFYINQQSFNKKDLSAQQVRNFESKVENLYVQDKRSKCSKEQIIKNELMEEAQGWFTVNTRKLAEAERMPMPNCQKLRDLNLI